MDGNVRQILNTDRIGTMTEITLPGFEYRNKTKGEPCQIHYLEYGQGEPLLLVHSIGQSLYTWRNIMPILSKYYRVISFDMAGFGFSGRPDSMNYSVDEVADAILMFMDAIGLQKTNIMGFSFGAMYALCAVSKAEERFSKIITLQGGGVTKQMPKKIRKMSSSVFGAIIRESYNKKHLKTWLQECFYDATAVDKAVAEQYFETVDDFASRQAIMYALKNFDMEYAMACAAKIKGEVLVLWAGENRWRSNEQMEQLKKGLRRPVCHVIRNAGHLMHEEKAELVAEVVDKYIQFQGTNV